jgi:hypothetical protein
MWPRISGIYLQNTRQRRKKCSNTDTLIYSLAKSRWLTAE